MSKPCVTDPRAGTACPTAGIRPTRSRAPHGFLKDRHGSFAKISGPKNGGDHKGFLYLPVRAQARTPRHRRSGRNPARSLLLIAGIARGPAPPLAFRAGIMLLHRHAVLALHKTPLTSVTYDCARVRPRYSRMCQRKTNPMARQNHRLIFSQKTSSQRVRAVVTLKGLWAAGAHPAHRNVDARVSGPALRRDRKV
jgi:hypothetical protein